MRRHVAHAHFLACELMRYPLERVSLPRGLDFKPAFPRRVRRSAKLLARWFKKHVIALVRLAKHYQRVLRIRLRIRGGRRRVDPFWSVAALARMGDLWDHFSEQLVSFRLSGRPSAAARARFRALTTKQHRRTKVKARRAYRICARAASRLRHKSEWSRRCVAGARRRRRHRR
jgi:hypothetical protein